jgi:hypothetical protein
MSEHRVLLLQKSVIGTCALVALVLLASFYMVVSDAVQRGIARQRTAAVDPALMQATTAVAPQRSAARGQALLARVGN